MIKSSFKKLLHKYQLGQLDQAGTRFIERWYDAIGSDEASSLLQDAEKTALIRNTIHTNLLKHIHPQSSKSGITYWYYSAAACILVVCAILFTQKLSHKSLSTPVYVTIKTPPGILKKIELPDHSEIQLNSGSILRYNALTFKQKRQVFLDEGEAFFKVVKDARHPFSVHTSSLNTTVLGTSFNIKDYHQLKYTSVQVKTGRVRVSAVKDKATTVITANQNIIYNKTSGEMYKGILSAAEAGSWTNGTIVLQEATFAELSLMIYNRYQIRLKSNLPVIDKYRYTINIYQNQQMDEILNLICAVHQNKYRKERNEVIIY